VSPPPAIVMLPFFVALIKLSTKLTLLLENSGFSKAPCGPFHTIVFALYMILSFNIRRYRLLIVPSITKLDPHFFVS
jgi:hypothetical protein